MTEKYYEDPGATGTMSYHKVSTVANFLATDGVALMCNKLGCFWLMDIVMSYIPQLEDKGEFFVATLIEDKKSGRFLISDGDYNEILHQDIPYTDISQNVQMFLQNGSIDGVNPQWVLMLPSEY